jgi:hypothetical protein
MNMSLLERKKAKDQFILISQDMITSQKNSNLKQVIFSLCLIIIGFLVMLSHNQELKENALNHNTEQVNNWIYKDIKYINNGIIKHRKIAENLAMADSVENTPIVLRLQEAGINNVMVSLYTKEIFNCDSPVNDCFLNIVFDDNPIEKIKFKQQSNKQEIIIVQSKDFIQKLQQANRVIIEIPLYNGKNEMYEFNVADLKW